MFLFSIIPLLVTIVAIPLVAYLRVRLYPSPEVLNHSSTPIRTTGSFLTHLFLLAAIVWVGLLIIFSFITWLVLLPLQSLSIATDYNPLSQFSAILNFGWLTWVVHFVVGVCTLFFSFKLFWLQEKRLL